MLPESLILDKVVADRENSDNLLESRAKKKETLQKEQRQIFLKQVLN